MLTNYRSVLFALKGFFDIEALEVFLRLWIHCFIISLCDKKKMKLVQLVVRIVK